MTYVKINGAVYPAHIDGAMEDLLWDKRSSKSITLEMDYATANAMFVNGLKWSIISADEPEIEWDNSEYCVAGDLIDHRDGTITAKMGKLTELEEAYEIMLGGF